MNTTQIHSFSRKLAKEHGDTEALLLSYIGYKISRSKQRYDNRTWFFETLDELAQRYPYLSRSAIHNALTKLSSSTGPLITGNYNKKGYDRTKWYAFRDNQTQRHLQAEPVYFRVIDAEKYGVTEAILLMNLAHWIRKARNTEPDCQYHEMSPHDLATVLPYSESTIKRALKHLTSTGVGVLISRRPADGRCASEYCFADETQLQNYGGDENIASSNQDDKNAYLNMGQTNLNMSVSKADNSGPEANVSGPKANDYTIFEKECLKENSLEKENLKERNFQSASVPETFSLSNGSNQDRVSTATLAEPSNAFAEPIVGCAKVDVDANLYALAPLARVGTNDGQLSASNSAAPLPATPSLPSFKPAKPYVLFLDPAIDRQNLDLVIKLSSIKNEDDLNITIAHLAVEAIGKLAKLSRPEDLLHFVNLPNQKELDQALIQWATPFFNEIYEKHYSRPECIENEEYRDQFIYYSQRILSMGFHWLKFPDAQYYNRQQFAYKAHLAMFCVINPWKEKQAELRRIENIKQRAEQFKSPDSHLESSTTLSANEKMQVFNQSLMARNKIGCYDDRGSFVQQVVTYNNASSKLIREFFQLNPQFTVQHLNLVLDECIKLQEDYFDGGDDPQWHARNGRDISRLIRSFDIIAQQLNLLDQLPDITPLPIPETKDEPILA
jgi:hypothetical protein